MLRRPLTRLAIITFIAFAINTQATKAETLPGTESPPSPALIKLHEDETARSLGVVRPNSETTFVIPFKNTTESALRILSVKVGCACTKAEVDRHELAPGESAQLTATIRAGNRDLTQSTAITLGIARAGHPLEAFYATYQVTALVRDECRWSHDSGTTIRLLSNAPVKVMAANYGVRRWQDLKAVSESTRVAVNVKLIDLPLDGDANRQVAVLELSHLPEAEPFQESLKITLFSNTKDCAIKLGQLTTNVELPLIVDVVPRLLTVNEGRLTASLIVNENGSLFDDENVFATIGKEVIKPVSVRKVSGRWIEAKFELSQNDRNESHIIFHSKVGGELAISPATLTFP